MSDLAGIGFEFEHGSSRFALYHNETVALLLNDREMTDRGINSILHLTDAEVIKVHTINRCKVLKVLSVFEHHSKGKITAEMARRMQMIPLNPPFEVKLSAGIPNVISFKTTKSIYIRRDDGFVVPYLDRLKPADKKLMAGMNDATEYYVELQIEQEILDRASEFRKLPTG